MTGPKWTRWGGSIMLWMRRAWHVSKQSCLPSRVKMLQPLHCAVAEARRPPGRRAETGASQCVRRQSASLAVSLLGKPALPAWAMFNKIFPQASYCN
jgi:hypothetical protein